MVSQCKYYRHRRKPHLTWKNLTAAQDNVNQFTLSSGMIINQQLKIASQGIYFPLRSELTHPLQPELVNYPDSFVG